MRSLSLVILYKLHPSPCDQPRPSEGQGGVSNLKFTQSCYAYRMHRCAPLSDASRPRYSSGGGRSSPSASLRRMSCGDAVLPCRVRPHRCDLPPLRTGPVSSTLSPPLLLILLDHVVECLAVDARLELLIVFHDDLLVIATRVRHLGRDSDVPFCLNLR